MRGGSATGKEGYNEIDKGIREVSGRENRGKIQNIVCVCVR